MLVLPERWGHWLVEVGQRVKANDALFELDPRPIQADLVKAKASRIAAAVAVASRSARPGNFSATARWASSSATSFPMMTREWLRCGANPRLATWQPRLYLDFAM